MDSGPEKRCLLCGQTVPPNAVKCSACGKGRFETEKRHAEPRPPRPATRAAVNPDATPARPAIRGGPDAPAEVLPQPSRGGFLSRLLARLSGKG